MQVFIYIFLLFSWNNEIITVIITDSEIIWQETEIPHLWWLAQNLYRCCISSSCFCTFTASPSAVSINVSKNPTDYNSTVTFTGTYSSAVLTVTEMKWQKQDNSGLNEINIVETNYTGSSKNGSNPKLVINSVMFTDAASYRLVVSNRVGSGTSNSIQLNITGGMFNFFLQ